MEEGFCLGEHQVLLIIGHRYVLKPVYSDAERGTKQDSCDLRLVRISVKCLSKCIIWTNSSTYIRSS